VASALRGFVLALMLLLSVGAAAPLAVGAQGFVGETRCANPTCHGAAVPADPAADPTWRPWKSARTQWHDPNIDRHSRAYRTLTTDASKRIAAFMAVDATTSEKCLVCHAPTASAAPDSRYKVSEGVTCEHCHGPAQQWLDVHKAKDWPQKRAAYADKGFYDNNDFRRRAEKCASCHVTIDHEIVAAGHPPLQFEMVAYAQVMKHWDDSDEHPGVNPDPTLWALGQLVGLQHVAAAIAQRAAGNNYQSLGQFHGFKDSNCYQCHHKLIEDAARQGGGHADMLAIAFAVLFPDAKGTLTGRWNDVTAAVRRDANAAQQNANELRTWLEPFAARIVAAHPDQAASKRMWQQLINNAQTLGTYRVFSHSRQGPSNAERIANVDLPWWYTTGSREQTALAVQALCGPAFDDKRCAALFPQVKALVAAIDRGDQDPAAFSAALRAIKDRLY
jgi:hypothetical protein